ncbi:L,D-transpeptidase family protein [Rhodopseudomonas sp.]|uniref:L,D-transpeptidase family protein n=1 Tax=Rhodopseudomonas sp. TaxID=1078 RepID=UPI003451C9F2
MRIGALTAAAVFGVSSYAEAAASHSLFWPDSDTSYTRPVQPVPKRRHKAPRHHDAKLEQQEKQAAKPQGPLIISVSIQNQKLKVYDANGLFAETPISTGMRGHPTPLGVFSVIQKHKYHRSNIYSGAPMPYMQRITWSGIAMHAGVLPGYPASHGCIRMPMNFAVKMWGWTKMGARVIVTPGEITPENFSHPLLIAKKPAPVPETPVASLTPKPDSATGNTDKTPIADTTANPTVGSAHAELRSSVNLDDHKPEGVDGGSAASHDQVRTADASPILPSVAESVVLSDAVSSAKAAPRTDDEAAAAAVPTVPESNSVKAPLPATATEKTEATNGDEIATDKAADPVKRDAAKIDDTSGKATPSEAA